MCESKSLTSHLQNNQLIYSQKHYEKGYNA
jgi:hypothetical protein